MTTVVADYRVLETLPDGSLKAEGPDRGQWRLEPVPSDLGDERFEQLAHIRDEVLPRVALPVPLEGGRYLPVEWFEPPCAAPDRERMLEQIGRLGPALDRLWHESGYELPRSIELGEDPAGHLRLARLLGGEARPRLSALLAELAAGLTRLLTRPGAGGMHEQLPLNLDWTLQRALSGDPERSFRSFSEFTESLARRHTAARPHPDERRLPPVIHRKRKPRSKIARVLVALVVMAALWGLWQLGREQVYQPVLEDAVVVALPRTLLIYSSVGRNLLDRIPAPAEIVDVAGSEDGLLVASAGPVRQLLVYDLRQGRWRVGGLMEREPGTIEMDWDGTHLVVVEPGSRTAISHALRPREQWTNRNPPLIPTAMFAGSGRDLVATAHDESGTLVVVGDPTRGRLACYQAEDRRLLAKVKLEPFTALSLSSGGKTLLLARPGELVRLAPRSLEVEDRLALPGRTVVRLLQDEARGRLWAVHEDGQVSRLDLMSDRVLASSRAWGTPVDAVRAGPRLWLATTNALLILDAESLDLLQELSLPEPARGLTVVH
ncbi:MAG: hypothetical protein AMXMBFR33_14410 [Candidatus Xenobia bacterium]